MLNSVFLDTMSVFWCSNNTTVTLKVELK